MNKCLYKDGAINRINAYIKLLFSVLIVVVLIYFSIELSGADIINKEKIKSQDNVIYEDMKYFQIFDGTQYSHKPDFKEYGIKPINILYESRFWNKGDDKNRLPKEKKVRDLAKHAAHKNELLVVDIEAWWIHGNDEGVKRSVDKYVSVLRWIHDEEPEVRVGIFGVIPIEDHIRSSKMSLHPQYLRWKKENERLINIAKESDVIYPSVYTFYEDQDRWKRTAISMINLAKSYGKPVYVFLWPYYSERSKNKNIRLKQVPADYWQMQLETVWEYADGVVIWGGWDGENWRPAEWDEDVIWWKVTKEFIMKKKILIED